MTLSLQTPPTPLRIDEDGVARVGGTRVTLDTIVAAFGEGATPEEIAQQYPSLSLADVYATVSFYLSRRQEVDAYLRERGDLAERVRRENLSRFNPQGIRERLLARRDAAKAE